MARVSSADSGGPSPTAWLLRMSCCSCRTRSGGMRTVARSPIPVVTPYTVSPDATFASTTARAAAMRSRAPVATATASPAATRTTSSTDRVPPTSTGMGGP